MGARLPIFGRDEASEWKLTEINGQRCYIFLDNAVIMKAMEEINGAGWQVEDLPIFYPPDPCEDPTTEPKQKTCSDYTDPEACKVAGCAWVVGAAAGHCIEQ